MSMRAGWPFGPSPHAWGERPPPPTRGSTARTIPTRVGRTAHRLTHRRGSTDHPHTRGENGIATADLIATYGPSPHAWGERPGHRRQEAETRTIPTRVGRTVRDIVSHEKRADHPHTRGENTAPDRIQPRNTGPSPHAWGELPRQIADEPPDRTIPTRVGRTTSDVRRHAPCADHPHTRGENWISSNSLVEMCGPSPHAWGEREADQGSSAAHRTIPTRVGRTCHRGMERPSRSDHPHTRGENLESR